MKKLIIIKNLIIFLVIIQFASYAQDSRKVKIVSKKVGEIIDAEERKKYELFNEFDNTEFKEAQFFENKDKSKILVIYFNDGTKTEKTLTQTEYFEYQTQINKRPINYEEIDSTMTCIVKLIDESSISGIIVDIQEKEIKMRTRYMGLITIPKKRILDIVVLQLDGKQFSKYWMPNPHDSRHFFAPTARSMPKGEGYFQDIYLVVVSANYGFTDYLTIGGGLSIIPGISAKEQGYFIYPKVGFDLTEKISIGGGFIYVNFPGYEDNMIEDTITIPVVYNGQIIGDTTMLWVIDEESTLYRSNAGIMFAVGTYGNRENNITLGVGYAYLIDEFLKHPIIMVGGMYRLSRRSALVTENWFMRSWHEADEWDDYTTGYYNTSIISYGIRFFGERMSIDLAFFQITGEMGFDEFIFPGIPYLDFVVKF
ncbi:hypothetical protein KA005_43415 [bacterium]|nr:hypothetical protein [bacterium]